MAKTLNMLSAEKEADKIGEKFMDSNNVLDDMSREFGADFSDIRIHTDSAADSKVKSAGYGRRWWK